MVLTQPSSSNCARAFSHEVAGFDEQGMIVKHRIPSDCVRCFKKTTQAELEANYRTSVLPGIYEKKDDGSFHRVEHMPADSAYFVYLVSLPEYGRLPSRKDAISRAAVINQLKSTWAPKATPRTTPTTSIMVNDEVVSADEKGIITKRSIEKCAVRFFHHTTKADLDANYQSTKIPGVYETKSGGEFYSIEHNPAKPDTPIFMMHLPEYQRAG